MRIIVLGLFLAITSFSQDDNILVKARTLFHQDQTQKAVDSLNEYLRAHPGDSDARVLLGLICSWDKRYDEGRKAFTTVLDADPDYKDAALGLINLELWSGHPARSEEVVRLGLSYRPDDPDYKTALVRVKIELAPTPAAIAAAQPPNAPNPADEHNWEVGLNHSNIWFSDHRSTWSETAAAVSKPFGQTWVTARFSRASWFGSGSNLIELESYPRIRPGTYGYIAAGFSPDAVLYARRRGGAEIFQNFPNGFEGSAGIRYYHFVKDSVLYTGSIARYFGNWWVLGRTFITPDATVGLSKSLLIQARHYQGDADHFVGLRFGIGSSPFEVRSINEVDVQKSTSLALEALWKFKNGIRFRINTGVARQTRLFFAGPLWQIQADGTVYYAF